MKRRKVWCKFAGLITASLALCGWIVLRHSGPAEAGPKPADVPGAATVSGMVNSPVPFKAARVYLRNVDKGMLYMVYTSGGKFEAVQLFPGQYELSVQAKGLESDVEKLTITTGQKVTANLALHAQPDGQSKVEYVSYDDLYPAGPGRKVAERLCIRCHGPNFLPSKRWPEAQWNSSIDFMMGDGAAEGGMFGPEDLSQADRKVFVKYLVDNFGPDSQARAVKLEKEMPVDEAKVSKAEFIEYYLPPDPPGVGVNDPRYASKTTPWGKRRVSQDVQFDAQGNVWITDRGIPNRLNKLDPRTGEVQSFVTPAPTSGVHDLDLDRDGMVWVPRQEGKQVDVFNPKTLQWAESFPLDPDGKVKMRNTHNQSVAIDSKQNVYFNYILGDAISMWDRETRKASTYLLPPRSWPYGIVTDTKDNLWIAEFHGGRVTKFDPNTKSFTDFTPPTYPALIRRLIADPHDNVWFGLFSAAKLDKLDTATGKITEYPIPSQNAQPYDVKSLGDELWFSDGGQGGAIVMFDPKTESFTYYPVPQTTDMPKIRVTREGAIWYAPRSAKNAGAGVLYPDKTKIDTLAAYR
jgi:streptogramin lyase